MMKTSDYAPFDSPPQASNCSDEQLVSQGPQCHTTLQLLLEQLTDGSYLAESDCDGKHCLPVLLFEDDDTLFSCFL